MELLQEDSDIENLFTCLKFTRNLEALWTIPVSISSTDLNDYVSILLSGLKRNISKGSKKKGHEIKEAVSKEPKKFVSEQVILTFLLIPVHY